MTWWQQLLIILAGNVVVGLTVFVTLRSIIRKAKAEAAVAEKTISKTDADTAKTYAEASKLMAEQNADLQKQITEYKEDTDKRIDALEAEIEEYKRGTRILIAQMRRLEIVPEWTPQR